LTNSDSVKKEEVFNINGTAVPRSQAKIAVLDYGFLYGYSLYETLRTYSKKPFRLDNHLARLRYSGDKLGILVNAAFVREAVQNTIKANEFENARLRITLSAGEGTMTPDPGSCALPTLVVLASEYQPPAADKYREGFKIIVSEIRRNSHSPVTFLKSGNTIENMLARQEAKKAPADEAVFLNEKGYVSEAAGSNIFLVSKGALKTPRYETGILPGVTRVVIFELAFSLGLKVKEAIIRLSEIQEADEVFLTNSLIEIMPVSEISGKKIGDGKPGKITTKLMKAYKSLVKKETSMKDIKSS
jgi:branched-chain amino acid aminotransferase